MRHRSPPASRPHRHLFALPAPVPLGSALLAPALLAAGAAAAAPQCSFLLPIGGRGEPVVQKQVGAPRPALLGLGPARPSRHTDFPIERAYDSYRVFFTAVSADPAARYPVQAWMTFTDGSSQQLVDALLSPTAQGRMFGPFPSVHGRQATQMNVKVGAGAEPGTPPFHYRLSVQGCLGG